MDVWIGVLGFVLFLGFATAVMVCISAIKRQTGIIIKSRLHRKLNNSEVIYVNLGLVLLAVLLLFEIYAFVPAILTFVLFVLLTTRIQSGLTAEGALIGTTFIDWEFMDGYKLVDCEDDTNIIILKIRANRRQYVLVCDRRDRHEIAKLMEENHVKATEVCEHEHSKQEEL